MHLTPERDLIMLSVYRRISALYLYVKKRTGVVWARERKQQSKREQKNDVGKRATTKGVMK
jgi:hypothetical protein